MDATLPDAFRAVAKGREVHRINCHRNFCQRKQHRGRGLWIARKGAIQMTAGQLGVIPGSMGTHSYILEGRGSEASYQSASQGAGRSMGRGEARRTLTPESLETAMKGIAWNRDALGLIDESPAAYQDAEAVITAQDDLVPGAAHTSPGC